MSTKAEQDAAAQAQAAEMEKVKIAARAEGVAEGEAKGKAEGIKTERERIGAILAAEESKGRAKLALHLALQTDDDADKAKKMLAAAPKEAGGQDFAAAMSKIANPKVGPGGDLENSGNVTRIDTTSIYSARRQASAGKQ